MAFDASLVIQVFKLNPDSPLSPRMNANSASIEFIMNLKVFTTVVVS